MQDVQGLDQALVDLGGHPGRLLGQRAHEHARGQAVLVDDHRLAPAGRIAEVILIVRAVVAAAVVQIEHQGHARMADQLLDAAHCGEFRIAFVQAGEFAVHVPVQAARALDDAGEIEVGHHPDGPFLDVIAGRQQGGGGETARLFALDAAHHQHDACRVAQADGGEIQGKGLFTACRDGQTEPKNGAEQRQTDRQAGQKAGPVVKNRPRYGAGHSACVCIHCLFLCLKIQATVTPFGGKRQEGRGGVRAIPFSVRSQSDFDR